MNDAESTDTTEQGIQAKLSERMMDLFETIVKERRSYYQKNPDAIPSQAAAKEIISKYSYQNALISGGASLIPGPWGMAAAIPEIVLVIRNQIMMVYDIGMAYGQSKVLTKELLAGVFVSSLGIGGIGLLTMQGSKVLVKRVSLRVFQRIIALLAGKVTQQLLKSMISKWLPVVGAAAMAAWSKYSTNLIGKKTVEIMSKTIEIDEEELTLEDIPAEAKAEVTVEPAKMSKILSLANLMKVDGTMAEAELAYIETLITNSNLDSATASELRTRVNLPEKATIDYTVFSQDPDESLGLMMDLVALAKRDGEFHITEKMYIKQIGKLLGYSEEDTVEMMELG